jgi:hypothetical protein
MQKPITIKLNIAQLQEFNNFVSNEIPFITDKDKREMLKHILYDFRVKLFKHLTTMMLTKSGNKQKKITIAPLEVIMLSVCFNYIETTGYQKVIESEILMQYDI